MAWWIPIAALGALLLAFFTLLIVRGIRFKPALEDVPMPVEIEVDGQKAINDLAAMVRCKTVSYYDEARIDRDAFDRFHALLTERFPRVSEACTLENIGRTGLLYRLPGRSSDKPSVFMAHYDVVPADESAWERPPFDGILDGDVLWGRGTLDTKSTLLGVLSAAEHLLKDGFVPKNDMYFAFGGDEETTGSAQQAIVATFRARGITPAFVLDEGGAVVENVFPGVKRPIAVIGTAEKGMLVASFTIEGAGGHASSPPPHTPVGKLAAAVTRIEAHPFPSARYKGDVLNAQISERINTDYFFNLAYAVLCCYEDVLGFNIGPVPAGVDKGRRGNAHMHLRSTGITQQLYDPFARCTPDNRLVNKHNAFAAYGCGYGIELYTDLVLPGFLTGGDKGAGYVSVFNKTQPVGNSGLLCVTDCGVYAGVRYAYNNIRLYGMLKRQKRPRALTRHMDACAVNNRIGSGKVYILKNTRRGLCLTAVGLY